MTEHMTEQWQSFQRSQKVFVWLAAIFLTCLIVANLIGSFLFEVHLPFALPFLGGRALLSAGTIPFPVTFILTDLINEYYGEKGARFITYIGFAMSILVFALLSVGEQLPVAMETVITQANYLTFSTNYASMFIASLAAYLVGQLLDIQVFQVFHRFTKSKLLWLRATGSTVISQIFDSLIVTYIAFNDNLPLSKILHIAGSNYCWKFMIAILITPLLYLGHALLKKILFPKAACP